MVLSTEQLQAAYVDAERRHSERERELLTRFQPGDGGFWAGVAESGIQAMRDKLEAVGRTQLPLTRRRELADTIANPGRLMDALVRDAMRYGLTAAQVEPFRTQIAVRIASMRAEVVGHWMSSTEVAS